MNDEKQPEAESPEKTEAQKKAAAQLALENLKDLCEIIRDRIHPDFSGYHIVAIASALEQIAKKLNRAGARDSSSVEVVGPVDGEGKPKSRKWQKRSFLDSEGRPYCNTEYFLVGLRKKEKEFGLDPFFTLAMADSLIRRLAFKNIIRTNEQDNIIGMTPDFFRFIFRNSEIKEFIIASLPANLSQREYYECFLSLTIFPRLRNMVSKKAPPMKLSETLIADDLMRHPNLKALEEAEAKAKAISRAKIILRWMVRNKYLTHVKRTEAQKGTKRPGLYFIGSELKKLYKEAAKLEENGQITDAITELYARRPTSESNAQLIDSTFDLNEIGEKKPSKIAKERDYYKKAFEALRAEVDRKAEEQKYAI